MIKILRLVNGDDVVSNVEENNAMDECESTGG